MIVLKIVGPYGDNGWEDPDTGVRYYNNVTMSPFGPVKNIKTHRDGGELVIDQAPEYALIGRGLIESEGSTDGFGITWVDVIGRNGHARYQVLDEDVVWDDDRDKVLSTRLCMRAFSDWEPESEYTEEPRRETVEVPVTEENLNA